MFERICLVHYHEVGLKGRNRASFEHRLLSNMEAALVAFDTKEICRISGHLLVVFENADDLEPAARILLQVPGVARVSRGWRCARDPEEYNLCAELAMMDCGEFESFKVVARRSNTDYPIDSMQLNQLVGAHLCAFAPDKKVKMKDPDVKVHVEIIQGSAYVFSRSDRGIGGLPVGTAGKVVSLMSGGIDSPVATWKLMKRGAVVVGVHFSGAPVTDDASEYIVDDLAHALAPAGGIGRIYTVPFGNYQKAIASECPPNLRIVLYRRLMFRIAQGIARIENAKALVTGESLGQVASQTLENIAAVNAVVDIPVLRPLIGSDKLEIIDVAKQLGTFEISSRPADDCCTLFMPRSPETHARIKDCETAEALVPIDAWIDEILDNLKYRDYPCPSYKAPRKMRREGSD
ncbi:MAG: tRNA 4-thiouridine(8) synthase ThiI [Coriobacteriia bacterium]|nr:MAG: tRNA 4-thiouridine(8) synthase ThiI [Coriobacteriia bacterium]